MSDEKTPAVEDRETERLAVIAPFLEQDDVRPDFLPPEPEDHAWVKALLADREERTLRHPNGDEYTQDPTIMTLPTNEVAYLLGYDTAIHKLRELANDDGLKVQLITLEGHDPDDGSPAT